MLTKESIIALLETDKRAVARALQVLTARQTSDEQASENTRYLNGRGFRPCHARMGTSMAKFFDRNGYLSPKQIAYWRGRDKTGAMRIGIYAGQLLEEAQSKIAMKNASTPKSAALTAVATEMGIPVVNVPLSAMTAEEIYRDLGNDMERRMVLQERYDDVLDSDDPKLIDPIKSELDEIDAFWAKIRNKT
jgi:hypothetical protein